MPFIFASHIGFAHSAKQKIVGIPSFRVIDSLLQCSGSLLFRPDPEWATDTGQTCKMSLLETL